MPVVGKTPDHVQNPYPVPCIGRMGRSRGDDQYFFSAHIDIEMKIFGCWERRSVQQVLLSVVADECVVHSKRESIYVGVGGQDDPRYCDEPRRTTPRTDYPLSAYLIETPAGEDGFLL